MADLETATRGRIVEVARTWLGTAYHHQAAVKGHGADCAMFVAKVYEEAGATGPIDVAWYTPQWFLHHDRELYAECVEKHAHEIEQGAAQPGDLALFKFGRTYSHGAIIMPPAWPAIIHAHYESRGVVIGRGIEGRLRGRPVKFFSLW